MEFSKYIGFRHKKTKKLPLYMVKVEHEDHFLYNEDELASYIKNGEGNAKKSKKAEEKEEAPQAEKAKGLEYIEFYEARELEKIIEKIVKLGVDVEDYDPQPQGEEKKAKEKTKKQLYTIKAESGTHYFSSLKEILRFVMDAGKEGMTIQRYKGLGEMNPEQLWETTMDPEKRTLLRVTLEDAVEADAMFTVLMGEQVEPRREFIEKHAHEVKVLDI